MTVDRLSRTIYLLADTPIPDDPRVRRLGDLLHNAGWDVTGIGLGGWISPTPAWRVLAPEQERLVAQNAPLLMRPGSKGREFFKAIWRGGAFLVALLLWPVTALVRLFSRRPGAALERLRVTIRDDAEWPIRQFQRTRRFIRNIPHFVRRAAKWARLHAGDERDVEDDFLFRAMPHLRELGAIAAQQQKPGLWVANDWRLLPVAAAAKESVGGRFVYDSHEFATQEYAERLSWRVFQKPVAAAVEKRWIGKASAVVSVSPGITDALRELYGLTCPLDTVRNTPVYAPAPFRPAGAQIELLYHGVVAPGRGLEACIEALSLLQPRFRLSIRGPIPIKGYREKLEDIGAAARVQDRVRLLPPVPMTDLVAEAAAFDIGLMALPGHSAHNRFALPNKIFEYLMAGLALCVSDLPAMADVVRSTGAGVTFSDMTPQAIAKSLNGLTADQLNAHKGAARKAAETYNWELEGGRFMALLETLLEPAR